MASEGVFLETLLQSCSLAQLCTRVQSKWIFGGYERATKKVLFHFYLGLTVTMYPLAVQGRYPQLLMGPFTLLSGTNSYYVAPNCAGPMPPPVNGAVYTLIWDY